jgi:hypothetical protein
MTDQLTLTVMAWPPVAAKVSLAPPLLSKVVSATETVTDWFDARVPPDGVAVTWGLELVALHASDPAFDETVTACLPELRLSSRGVTFSVPGGGWLLLEGGLLVEVGGWPLDRDGFVVVVVVVTTTVFGGTPATLVVVVVVTVVVVVSSVVVTVAVSSVVVGGGAVDVLVGADGSASRWSAGAGVKV